MLCSLHVLRATLAGMLVDAVMSQMPLHIFTLCFAPGNDVPCTSMDSAFFAGVRRKSKRFMYSFRLNVSRVCHKSPWSADAPQVISRGVARVSPVAYSLIYYTVFVAIIT